MSMCVTWAHVLALGAKAKGRYIALNEPMPTFADIARMMHAIDAKIPAPKFVLPAFSMRAIPLLDRINSWMGGTPRSMTPEMAATLAGREYRASAKRIRDELGWQPQISLRQSLADTIAALRQLPA
jgi:nucleoside-diphosphate-sugar epimerase